MVDEEVEELTEEELKKKEDEFFLDAVSPNSMQRVRQGGEFLEEGPATTMYQDEAVAEEMKEEAQNTFNQCAQIASMEHNPGMILIFTQIDEQCELLHKDNENMIRMRKVDASLIQANIFAAVKLRELKDWIESKVSEYKREVLEQSAEEKVQ